MGIEFQSNSTKKSTILLNGKEISIDEIPEEFKEFLKDENKDGQPDIMEDVFGGGPIKAAKGLIKVVKASKNLPVSISQQQKVHKSYTPIETTSVWRKLAIAVLILVIIFLVFRVFIS